MSFNADQAADDRDVAEVQAEMLAIRARALKAATTPPRPVVVSPPAAEGDAGALVLTQMDDWFDGSDTIDIDDEDRSGPHATADNPSGWYITREN
jgi:hypothetical protein